MPNNNSLPRIEPYRLAEEEEQVEERARPRWFAAGDREADYSANEERDERRGRDREPQAHSELFRAGKIDAYLRYLRMRPAAREAEPVTLRRSTPVRERIYRSYEEDDSEEVRLYGFQQRSIRRPSPRAPRLTPRRRSRSRTREIAVAAILSLAVAGVTGVIVYDRTSDGMLVGNMLTGVTDLWGEKPIGAAPAEVTQPPAALADAEPDAVPVAQQVAVSKKTVSIAQLEVGDVSGMASSPIPLSLKAEPGVPGQDLAFRLSGLPENAYLTAGKRVSGDAWMLGPGEQLGVNLVVPGQAGQFLIAVEALESRTGDLAAPVKEIAVSIRAAVATQIEPAAAPASVARNFNLEPAKPPAAEPQPDSAVPIPAPLEKTSIIQSDAGQALMRSGDKLLNLGELTAARQFYAKALDQGIAEAALKLGQTYDPAVFAEKNVQGLKPDAAMAMKYYLQAQASGIADASQSISGLDAWMQR